jgi:putative peptidoglycan lipid II flippase
VTQAESRPYPTARSVTNLTFLAVLSPAVGLMVEIVLAWRFGASGVVDAFRVATLLLVFGNQFFLNQVLLYIIVPLFSQYRAKGLQQEGWRLAFSLAVIFGAISLTFIFWVWSNPDALVGLLAPGLSGAGKTAALQLVRYFSVALILMVWSGVIGGILQVFRIFWVPLASQTLTNLLVIAAIFTVGREWGSGALALGVLLGSFAMFALHFYLLLFRVARDTDIRWLECLRLGPWDGVIRALRLAMPLVVMIFVTQWFLIVINRTLSEMSSGTIAEYGYAFKLSNLPYFLPLSLTTVLFPAFSDAYAHDDPLEFSRLVMRSTKMILLLTVPLSSLLFVMRDSLVFLTLQWGAMNTSAANDISGLFGILLVSVPAVALSLLLQKVAFSRGDMKSPAVTQVILALLIALFVPYAGTVAGAKGAVWAYTIAVWMCTVLLIVIQAWWYRAVQFLPLVRYSCLIVLIALGTAAISVATREAISVLLVQSKPTAILSLFLAASMSVACSYRLAKLIGVHEVSELSGYIRWQWERLSLSRTVRKRDYQ